MGHNSPDRSNASGRGRSVRDRWTYELVPVEKDTKKAADISEKNTLRSSRRGGSVRDRWGYQLVPVEKDTKKAADISEDNILWSSRRGQPEGGSVIAISSPSTQMKGLKKRQPLLTKHVQEKAKEDWTPRNRQVSSSPSDTGSVIVVVSRIKKGMKTRHLIESTTAKPNRISKGGLNHNSELPFHAKIGDVFIE